MAAEPSAVGPLQIRPLNIEKGSDRFSYQSDTRFPPQTATWRNNLVALSQRRNLLFTATLHQIYVWEPTGPSQTLGTKPRMIITPVIKCPENEGYIAPQVPHAINNVLVGDLGLDEVLLLVTDSGNVCGYRVETIFSALERAEQGNRTHPLDDTEVPPFFVESVGSSAWGLAIHKYSRQIAVSANTGHITVFAFALANSGSGGQLDPNHPSGAASFADNDQTWLHVNSAGTLAQLQSQMPDKYRTQNIRLTYTGHFTNIPSVSFLNCDFDSNGAWMLSTDIDNKILVWKVWENLQPCNAFCLNDASSNFMSGVLHNEDRGWAVLALDPRTFRLVKTAEEALGGPPQFRVKNGETFLDITEYVNRIPDASHLYNYFPPAVKTERDQLAMPDIFSADCRLFSSSESSNDPTAHDEEWGELPHGFGGATDDASTGLTGTGNPHPSDSTDAFSHSAVDGSAQHDDASQGVSHGANTGTGAGQATGQNPGDTTGNGPATSLEEMIMQMAGLPQLPTQGPLTTAEFLQLALIDGLGAGHSANDDVELFDDDDDSDSELDLDSGEEMEDDEEENEEDDDRETDGNGSPGHVVGPSLGTTAYNMFDRMFRSAFPADPDPYGFTETLINNPPPAVSLPPKFSILHFSQTDIRLIPYPFAPHHSVACDAPLRQPITHPVASIRACDRFNMVEYIPEHGLVVAASQKGRAAIISLTESEETGPAFRVDWIVPFESQEKYGERPLKPLLGMSVSPMPGFELSADVSFIPPVAGDNDMDFHYQPLNRDTDDSSPAIPSDPNQSAISSAKTPDAKTSIETSNPATPTSNLPHPAANRQPTHAESHASANRSHCPDERWRGWNPSRRYRLLLMYSEHTVMAYEFWYAAKTEDTACDGEGDALDDDPYVRV